MKKLTPEQLKDAQNALAAANDGKPWQFHTTSYGWIDAGSDSTVGTFLSHDMLTRPKPEPKTRPWNCPEDVPGPVCWIRYHGQSERCAMILALDPIGVWNFDTNHRERITTWEVMPEHEYSTDRREWKKCEVVE